MLGKLEKGSRLIGYLDDHRRYLVAEARYGGVDVLRCVAIMAVVLYHFELMPIGWMGVDLFFVLSGFLIGGMILSALDGRKFSFTAFYWHRALRILPTYYAAFIGMVLLRGIDHPIGEIIPVVGLFHTTARYFWDVAYSPLTVEGSWSLVIEEHFYIIAPLAMTLAYMAFKRRGVLLLCAVAVVAGPLVRLMMTSGFSPDDGNWYFASFIQFHSRFDELAAGILVAVIAPRLVASKNLWIALAVATAVALALFVTMQLYRGSLYTPWMMTRETIWMPTFFAAMFGAWVFALRDMRCPSLTIRLVARLSYPLYLFHFFVLLIRNLHPEARDALDAFFGFVPSQAIQIMASILLAYLASLLIEFPFLRMYKPDLSRRRVEHIRSDDRVGHRPHAVWSAAKRVERDDVAV